MTTGSFLFRVEVCSTPPQNARTQGTLTTRKTLTAHRKQLQKLRVMYTVNNTKPNHRCWSD